MMTETASTSTSRPIDASRSRIAVPTGSSAGPYSSTRALEVGGGEAPGGLGLLADQRPVRDARRRRRHPQGALAEAVGQRPHRLGEAGAEHRHRADDDRKQDERQDHRRQPARTRRAGRRARRAPDTARPRGAPTRSPPAGTAPTRSSAQKTKSPRKVSRTIMSVTRDSTLRRDEVHRPVEVSGVRHRVTVWAEGRHGPRRRRPRAADARAGWRGRRPPATCLR